MSKNIRAYPSGESYTTFDNASGVTTKHGKSPLHHGMTLRDHFAGLAMQGFVSLNEYNTDMIVKLSYDMADAMLAERDKKDDSI